MRTLKQKLTYLMRSRMRGFTLIEMMVTLVVVSFGAVVLVQSQTRSLVEGADARLRVQAVALASQKAEQLGAFPVEGTGNDDVSNEAMAFSRNWSVAVDPTHPSAMVVSVGMNWDDRGKVGKSFGLSHRPTTGHANHGQNPADTLSTPTQKVSLATTFLVERRLNPTQPVAVFPTVAPPPPPPAPPARKGGRPEMMSIPCPSDAGWTYCWFPKGMATAFPKPHWRNSGMFAPYPK